MESTPKTWRLRVELDDSPGALARMTIRLAERSCNVLALSVIPVPGGVIDELVVRAAPGLLPADLLAAVRAEGGRCVGITPADMRDLVDGPTAALRAAGNAMRLPGGVCDAVRTVLGADSVVVAEGDVEVNDHQIRLETGDATLVARRGWAPFTQVEVARAEALVELLGTRAPTTSALLTDDGMAVVLRPGLVGDADAVAALHTRCSMGTLFNRYHSGLRTLPRRWLHRLLTPPRGTTVLAQCGDAVIGMGQLIPMSTPDSAEVSLLVEDAWQGKGVGTGLLLALARTARAAGYRELVGWCLTAETGLLRTAAKAGLPTSSRREDGLLRVSVGSSRAESASQQVASG